MTAAVMPMRKLPSAWRAVQRDAKKLTRLRHVTDETTRGIRRLGWPGHFRYIDARGRAVHDRRGLERIRSLAIPPAWTRVWICPDPNGHIQATGRDARGRKQYRYHPRWREIRDEVKYGRLIPFAEALRTIRRRTASDLRKNGLPREKVLAAVVQLLEKTLIRIGNEEYARQNHSFGLTTMRDQHARIKGSTVHFEFRGKSGIRHAIDLQDRLARIVKACRDLPGYELFQYVDERGARQVIDSADVNAYLKETTGQPFTAKDFRTWAGTVLAAEQLAACERCRNTSHGKRMINNAIAEVAKRLGNTKAVCRKSYVHPAILDAYLAGRTLSCDEAAVVDTIRGATIIARCRRAS
jgi:DNA topoisomerase-1